MSPFFGADRRSVEIRCFQCGETFQSVRALRQHRGDRGELDVGEVIKRRAP